MPELKQIIEKFKKELALMGVGLTLLMFSVFLYKSSPASVSPEVKSIVNNSSDSFDGESTTDESLVVEVTGEVESAGVFSLPGGSRIHDAISKAGGFSKQANLDWISKNLNQAAKLVDGQKIYIPKKGEGSDTNTSGSQSSDLINLNQADLARLDSLPGVGPKTAEKIISGRPYSSVEDLLGRGVVGAKLYEQIKNMVSVY